MIALLLWMTLGQEDPSVTVARLLPALVENGRRYEEALPSLSCEETVRSQKVHKGKVKSEVVLSATLTISRTGDEKQPFQESHHWKTRDGAAIAEDRKPQIPYFVNGVFANALGFGSMATLACIDTQLDGEAADPVVRLQMQRRADADALPGCNGRLPGMRKTVYVDRESGHVTKLIRTVPADQAQEARDVPYASVDYTPVPLGHETFWLPLRAEMHDDNDDRRMLVEYSGCHRYASTIRITGGTQTVPDAPAAPQKVE